jgi:hypothetical protein
MSGGNRCTWRKHVIENGSRFCDCQALIINPTAAKNAQVVTILTSVLIQQIKKEGGKSEPTREVPRTEGQTGEQ